MKSRNKALRILDGLQEPFEINQIETISPRYEDNRFKVEYYDLTDVYEEGNTWASDPNERSKFHIADGDIELIQLTMKCLGETNITCFDKMIDAGVIRGATFSTDSYMNGANHTISIHGFDCLKAIDTINANAFKNNIQISKVILLERGKFGKITEKVIKDDVNGRLLRWSERRILSVNKQLTNIQSDLKNLLRDKEFYKQPINWHNLENVNFNILKMKNDVKEAQLVNAEKGKEFFYVDTSVDVDNELNQVKKEQEKLANDIKNQKHPLEHIDMWREAHGLKRKFTTAPSATESKDVEEEDEEEM